MAVQIESADDMGNPADHPLQGDFGLTVPDFVATIDDPELDWLVRLAIVPFEGRLVARDVSIIAREAKSPPVTGTALRSVPIDAYLSRAREKAAQPEIGVIGRIREITGTRVVWQPFLSTQDREEFVKESRRRSQHEWLPLVADAYREALNDPTPTVSDSPTQAVADRLHFSRGHASRLVAAARKAKLLGPASPGRAGERPRSLRKSPRGGGPK